MADENTILAVDDESNNLRALKLDLEDSGYEVIPANDGLEGWDSLQLNKGKIKAILLDRMMPNMNGMEFMKKIKAQADVANIPVIMQTAAAEKEQVIEGINAGVYYYLTKPYDKNLMLSIVTSAVEDYGNYSNLRNELRKFTRKLDLVKEALFEIQTLDDAQYLSTFLAQFFPNPDNVVFGISELLINAVEHGNLGITYDEKTTLKVSETWEEEIDRRLKLPEYVNKKATVNVLRNDKTITLTIKDEGNGFHWQDYLEISPDRAMDNHGRGIALSRMMSFDELEYIGSGNEVKCTVSLAEPEPANTP